MAEIKYLDLTGLQRYDQKIKEVVNIGLDAKIGKDDAMLTLTSGGGSKTETVSFEQYGRYEINNLHGSWTILVNGDGGYGPGSITLSDPNRDGAQIAARSNYNTNVKFVCENGTIKAYGYDDNAGGYGEQGSLTEGSGLYYIEFNDKAFNGTIEIQGVTTETSLNTNESLKYINDSMVEKIGKDDVMLSISGISSTIDMTQGSRTPLLSGDWDVEIDSTGHYYGNHKIYKENGDVVYTFIGDGPYVHNVKYSCRGGHIGIYSEENEDIGMGNPIYSGGDTNYYIELTNDTQAVATIKSYGEVEANTKTSIGYLNENKADKAEVNSSLDLKADKTEVDTKIGKSDTMLSIESSVKTIYKSAEGMNSYIVIPANNYWEVEFEVTDPEWNSGYSIDLFEFVDGGMRYSVGNVASGVGNYKIINDNGTVTTSPVSHDYYLDPSLDYILYLESGSGVVNATIKSGKDGEIVQLNTQQSLSHLNDNKADKSDIDALDFGVKDILLGNQDLGDTVVFHNSDFFKQGPGADGRVPLDPGSVYFSTVDEFDSSDGSYDQKLIGVVAGFDNKANTWDIPTDISQLSNDAGYAVADDLKISEVTEGLGENVAKAYKFEGGAESAVIEIPKDQTLKSVELGKYATEGDAASFVVDPTGEILRFIYIIADGSEKVVDVNVSNLITEAELDPVYDLIDTKLDAANVLTVSNDEIDAMFA